MINEMGAFPFRVFAIRKLAASLSQEEKSIIQELWSFSFHSIRLSFSLISRTQI